MQIQGITQAVKHKFMSALSTKMDQIHFSSLGGNKFRELKRSFNYFLVPNYLCCFLLRDKIDYELWLNHANLIFEENYGGGGNQYCPLEVLKGQILTNGGITLRTKI